MCFNEKSARYLVALGNDFLSRGEYSRAIAQYVEIIIHQLEVPKYLFANLFIARQKRLFSRNSTQKPSVAVCGWDLAHNAAGRVHTLAQIYEKFSEVEIIGSVFPIHGRDIWGPIRESSIVKHFFIVDDDSRFIDQAFQLVAAHPYDIVHLSKPRIPNIIFGILYKVLWGAKVILDIDDDELAFFDDCTPLQIKHFLYQHCKSPELKDWGGKDWTRLSVGLVPFFDDKTVANSALQNRYGGQIVAHARDECHFRPMPTKRFANRIQFGIDPSAEVVIFLGTPRSHKGLVETAHAVSELNRANICFVVIGDFCESCLKEELLAISGVNFVFVGNQPFDTVPEILAIGDVCVLLQDSQSQAALYQTPAKLSDALACGLPVLATITPALGDAFLAGAILPIQETSLVDQLDEVLENATIRDALRERGIRFFKSHLSIVSNVLPLRQLVDKSVNSSLNAELEPFVRCVNEPLYNAYQQYIKKQTIPNCDGRVTLLPSTELKIAFVIYVSVPELWPDLARRLRSVSCSFDVLVTTTSEHAEVVKEVVKNTFPDACVYAEDKDGMDIITFLRLIPDLVENRYLAVCKVGTTKGLQVEEKLWAITLDSLIGNAITVEKIVTAFSSEPSLAMVGNASLYLSMKEYRFDKDSTFGRLLEEFAGYPVPQMNIGSWACNMFWVRPEFLANFARFVVQNVDKSNNNKSGDANFAWAIERLCGLLPALQERTVGRLYPSSSAEDEHVLQISSAYIATNNANLDVLSAQYKLLKEDCALLEESGLFDRGYYLQQCPDLASIDCDLLRHYLLIGRFQNKTPNPDFDPVIYTECCGEQLQYGVDPFLHYIRVGARGGIPLRVSSEKEELEIPNFRFRVLNSVLVDWKKLISMQRDSKKTSIIIPVFNNLEQTRKCIDSLYTYTPTDCFELIVVNNGSGTSTRNLLDLFSAQYSNLIVLHLDENLNFALGCNLGFAASKCEKVIFLNNDTTVTHNWLEPLIQPLERVEISAVQPQLLFPNGTIQCIGVVFSDKSPIGYPIYQGMRPEEDRMNMDRSFQAITGACIALRADDFAHNKGFDPSYINGQEDVDLCLRLNENGSRAWYSADSLVYHHEGQSANRDKYIEKNRLLFLERWLGKVKADDTQYYKEDGFVVQEYRPDLHSEMKGPLGRNIAVYRPILTYADNKTVSFIPLASPLFCQNQSIDKSCSDLPSDYRYALIVHVFHLDTLEDLACHAIHFPEESDQFITCPDTFMDGEIKQIEFYFPSAQIFKVPNANQDFGALLELMSRVDLSNYSFVCKIHSKKGKKRPVEWRRALLDGVLGNRMQVDRIIRTFCGDSSLMLAGAWQLFLHGPSNLWKNAENIRTYFDLLIGDFAFETVDWGFFAGTCFWIRTSILLEIKALMSKIEITSASYVDDGTPAHAAERIFGLLVAARGGKVLLNDVLDTAKYTIETEGFPSSGLRKQVKISHLLADLYKISPGTKQLCGALDVSVQKNAVSGWIAFIGDPLPRHFILKVGESRVEGVASAFRPDLKKNGINNGEHAFLLNVPDQEIDGESKEIVLIDKESSTIIAKEERSWAREERNYLDFEGFLKSSMTQPLIMAPFFEADKRSFAVMEGVANRLCASVGELHDQPLVSVIMPVYNRAEIVSGAIRSVLNQSYQNLELIVIDDGSTDKTIAVVQAFENDSRLKLLVLRENLGPSAARNAGLQIADGDIIAYLDSDNVWDDRYLAAVVGAFNVLSNADAIYSGILLYRQAESAPFGVRYCHYHRSLMENHNYVDLNIFAHRRKLLDCMDTFDDNLKRFVDYDFILRASEKGKLYSVPMLLCRYYYDKAENTITQNSNHKSQLQIVHENLNRRTAEFLKQADCRDLEHSVAVVIPNWQSLPDIQECLEALSCKNWKGKLQIIVVDNGSDEEVVDYLSSQEVAGKISLIRNSVNYGFTYAVNQGIEKAPSNADILLLNNDAIIQGGAVQSLQQACYSLPDAGITIPRQILPAGTDSLRTHVPWALDAYECDVSISAHHQNILSLPIFHDGGTVEMLYAPFFAAYIRREVISQIGLMDAEYGRHYRSDRIYCDMVRCIGKRRIYYVPEAFVIHKLQRATEQLRDSNQFRNNEYELMFRRNQWDEATASDLGFRSAPWDTIND